MYIYDISLDIGRYKVLYWISTMLYNLFHIIGADAMIFNLNVTQYYI